MTTPVQPLDEPRRPLPEWAIPLGLALAVVLTFCPVVTHDFTSYDDPITLYDNGRMNPPTLEHVAWYWRNAQYGIYIPLTQTVWAALAKVGYLPEPGPDGVRLNPWIFHIASVLVHVASTLAVFAILRRLVGRDGPAAIGALLFGLHPVQVESVAWTSGMKDVLFGMFALVSVWQYVVWAKGRERIHYWLALGAFVCSMLSKPTGMMTPLLIVVIDALLLRRPMRRIAIALGPWFILSLACAVVARLVQPGSGVPTTPLWTRPLIVGDTLAFYLLKLIWPATLTIDYGRRPHAVMAGPLVYVAWLLPAAVAVLAWVGRRKRPELLAAALIFVAGMLPLLGFMPFLFQYYSTVSDHYLYLPMLGPALAAAWLVRRYDGTAARVAAGVVLTLLAGRSLVQTLTWRDSEALYAHAIDANPRSFLGHTGVGVVHLMRGQYEQAIPHFVRAEELNPDYLQATDQLIQCYFFTGRYAEMLRKAREYVARAEGRPEGARAARLAEYRRMVEEADRRPATRPVTAPSASRP